MIIDRNNITDIYTKKIRKNGSIVTRRDEIIEITTKWFRTFFYPFAIIQKREKKIVAKWPIKTSLLSISTTIQSKSVRTVRFPRKRRCKWPDIDKFISKPYFSSKPPRESEIDGPENQITPGRPKFKIPRRSGQAQRRVKFVSASGTIARPCQ